MSNKRLITATFPLFLACGALPPKTEPVVQLGVGYRQTPAGEIDRYAADSVRTYEDSMPGSIDFAKVSHDLPYFFLRGGVSLDDQWLLFTEADASSSHLLGSIEDHRTVDAKTPLFDFGPTDNDWQQFLNWYVAGSLGARRNFTTGRRFRPFAQAQLGYWMLDAKSRYEVRVLDEPSIPWSALNASGAYQYIATTAQTQGEGAFAELKMGVEFPVGRRAFLGIDIGLHLDFLAKLKINKKTFLFGEESVKTEEDRRKVDSNGLTPTVGVYLTF